MSYISGQFRTFSGLVSVYLVAQDGLLHQPRVPVQTDPRIAPAPHLAHAHRPRSWTCKVVNPKVAASKLAWSLKHSASMSSPNGAEQEEVSFQTERTKVRLARRANQSFAPLGGAGEETGVVLSRPCLFHASSSPDGF